MTITVTMCAKDYAPDQVTGRYVRYAGAGAYRWCETGPATRAGRVYDLRQGDCAVDDLPPDVAFAAVARHGFWPSYVDWPAS